MTEDTPQPGTLAFRLSHSKRKNVVGNLGGVCYQQPMTDLKRANWREKWFPLEPSQPSQKGLWPINWGQE